MVRDVAYISPSCCPSQTGSDQMSAAAARRLLKIGGGASTLSYLLVHVVSAIGLDRVPCTEVNLARRPTGYIPTPANANFALGSNVVRGQLKVLYPATRWSRGRNRIGPNATKTREKWNTDAIL